MDQKDRQKINLVTKTLTETNADLDEIVSPRRPIPRLSLKVRRPILKLSPQWGQRSNLAHDLCVHTMHLTHVMGLTPRMLPM